MNLIIVESPAKAKTLKSFLSGEKDKYVIVASKGHIRDLPKYKFGIKIDNQNFMPEYEIDKDHKDLVEDIKKLAKDANKIYIATDEDREGEAIGYHIIQALGINNRKYPRIVFHEITKTAILNSLKNPREINMDMVNAQQARRLLDRIVGFKLSPLLNQKIQSGLSAGRVQSSALKIIIDREKEIKSFVPIIYYSIDAIFINKDKNKIEAQLVQWLDNKIQRLSLQDKDEADKILKEILDTKFTISNIETKSRKVSPPPPFMTSTLQQAASNELGFSPSKTMQIAQKLYEGVLTDNGITGVITYMRTDSLNISKIAQDDAIKIIEKDFGKNYIPLKPRIYITKQKAAQEAHEAIRPTRVDFTPNIASSYLKGDELNLYKLIYNRFLASQSVDAIFQSQNIYFSNKKAIFKASGSKLHFDGFYKIISNNEKDKLLPLMEINEEVTLKNCEVNNHSTEPPPRYSEASLIKTLENFGIGRPSTYAPTVSLLVKRNYIKIEKKQIQATDIAFTIIDLLQKYFLEIVDSKFTAKLEDKLDDIAECKLDWQSVLWGFYSQFLKKIDDGKANIVSLKITKPTGEICPECGKELLIRMGKYGEFISCSGFPKCKYIKKEVKEIELDNIICEKCGKQMLKKIGRNGEFLACSGYPKCKNTKSINNNIQKNILENIKCPKCNGDIIERFSKKGKFYGCSNYPKCNFISGNEPIDKQCPKCGYLMAKKITKTKTYNQCISCKYKD